MQVISHPQQVGYSTWPVTLADIIVQPWLMGDIIFTHFTGVLCITATSHSTLA